MGLHGELIKKLSARLPDAIKQRFEELKAHFA
jgi:hypothetical protein